MVIIKVAKSLKSAHACSRSLLCRIVLKLQFQLFNNVDYGRLSPPKIQGCRIDQQMQIWLKDQLQDRIANKGMAWPSRHATTIRHNIEIFQVILSNLMFRYSVWCFAKLFDTICVYAVPFYIKLSHFTQRYTICVYAVPFDIMLSHFTQRYAVCMYAVPFDITLSHFMQRYAVCMYAVPFDITLSHSYNSAKGHQMAS